MKTHYPVDTLHPDEERRTTTMNAGGRLIVMERPMVMGVLNATPDSFYAASRTQTEADIERRVSQMAAEGADIIDIGACSTRPGAPQPTAEEEWERLRHTLPIVIRAIGECEADGAKCEVASTSNLKPHNPIISIDTYRADIAERCVGEYGVHIINDISGGTMDPAMFATVARLGVPYVLTHIQGTPADMQAAPGYGDVTAEVTQWLAERIDTLHQMGVADVIVDPGFGFGKTLQHNYSLLAHLDHIRRETDAPLMVGLSRKSMVCDLLGITPDEALNGTTVLNTLALTHGADILRVHDVRAAVEACTIFMATGAL